MNTVIRFAHTHSVIFECLLLQPTFATSGFEHQLRQDYDRRIELIGWAEGHDLRHQLRADLGQQQDQLCPDSFLKLGQKLQPFYHQYHHQELEQRQHQDHQQELKVQQHHHRQQPQQHQFRDKNQLLTH